MHNPTFPPLPGGAPAEAPRRISPTDLAQYLRLDQCRRYLRLRLHERVFGQRFMASYGVAPQALPPTLTRAGASFEQQAAAAATRHIGSAEDCRAAALAGDDAFIGPDHNAVVLARAAALAPGARALLLQPRLCVTLGAWELRGDVDLLLLERDADGALSCLIADMKSSTAAKVEHRLQVACYHEMLAALLAQAGLACTAISTAIIYRGPAPGALAPADQARLDAQRAAALARLGIADAYLELVDDSEAYCEELRALVTAPASLAAAVAVAPFAELPFHLTYKCDGCLYNELCMKWAAEHDDLSLIPYLSDSEKNVLHAAAIRTTSQLAALKDFADPTTTSLVTPPAQQALVRKLAASRSIGPRLDELVHRARRYRRWRGDELRALSYIPSQGYGTLPAVDAQLHPNLVRVYLDVQHDYLHDQVYLLGALVAACAAGAEDPARRRSIVRMAAAPPSAPEQEQALLSDWLAATLGAIVELAAPDSEGRRRAPIHLIFNDRFAQRLLLDALARHFGALVGAMPLYDFITQIAGFDSPVVTLLDHERRELKNDPLVCPSLQALARHHGFDWGEYRAIFRLRLFDEVGRLDEEIEGPAAWYTSRARFSSQIPLEYAYAAWGELPPPPVTGHDDFAAYRRADSAQLRGFQARRLEALEHLARDFAGNRQTEKTPFELPELAAFEQSARSLADALHEFLMLERHTVLSAWKHARLAPPERRVLAGASLILRYEQADQSPEMLAVLAENERRRALFEAYRAAHEARGSGKQFRRNAAQKAETEPLPLPEPFRLRIELEGVDCDLPAALALSSFAPGDQVIIAPRWDVDSRLAPEQQRPYTPTAKQLLYGPRARLVSLNANGLVELEPGGGFGGDGRYSFGYSWRPLTPGARYTLESDPSDLYGKRCEEVVSEVRGGAANTLYARLAAPAAEQVAWPAAAAAAQQRFAAGLDALHAAGLLHGFDPHQRAYIAEHGATPSLLVQGPPGTGKSYSTAFALLARMQGALAAGQTFRALLSCKTHAATDVLLEKIAEVQAVLQAMRDAQPALFAAHFDPQLLSAPLFRIQPRDPGRSWPGPVRMLKREEARAALLAERACFAAITPFATAAACKTKGGGYHGQNFCDCLVLDEASQMNLPEALMAALPLREAGHLIIVGDHRQMPPIVQHDWGDERRRTFQAYRGYASLFESLLARTPAPPIVRFAESFRLHRDIARFLRDTIYSHDGIDYHSHQTATLSAYAHADHFLDAVLAPAHPLVVVVHDEEQSQLLNPYELDLVSPILQALAGPHGLNASHGLGVVVPHRAQRAALKAMLPELMAALLEGGLDEAAIDTVERFQGGERTAILVSATESDRDYLRSAGEFLFDPRRLNVALSRAKQKLILVAARTIFTTLSPDEESFAHAQLWKGLLRRTCTVLLWEGERAGVRVQVWGNQQ